MDNQIEILKKKLYNIINEYGFENIVISFSGGKDSTATLQILIDTIIEYKLENLYVQLVSSNTKIENPLLEKELRDKIEQFKTIMVEGRIKHRVDIVEPDCNHSFYFLTLGKGYATPQNRLGRWCTTELKINPIKRIYKNIDKPTLVLTGVRKDESSSRKNSIESFFHNELQKEGEYIYYYPPIVNLSTMEVWDYLTDFFRSDSHYLKNDNLWELYSKGTAEMTCPSVFDLTHNNIQSNCGKSRYGCYLCPLAKKSAIEINVEKGDEDLLPYLLVRKFYIENSKNPKNRRRYNRNKAIKFKEITIDENRQISYSLLETNYFGDISEFLIVNKKTKDDAKDYILILGNNYNYILRDKKDIIFKIEEKYYVAVTATLSISFRKEFYDYVLQIERDYNINIIDESEKNLILVEWEKEDEK